MDLALNIDAAAEQSLHHQLYQALRRSILSGRLSAGQRIPSTRVLAKSLGISRATVTLGYEQLISEGYLETIVGSGTSVSAKLPDELLQTPAIKVALRAKTRTGSNPKLSVLGTRISRFTTDPGGPPPEFNFTYWRPAVDQFPLQLWRRLLMRHCGPAQHDVLDYAIGAKGIAPLRAAIATYLAQARAVNCTPEQIIIVAGSQQALQFCAQVLVNQDDLVAMEEPGYLGARQAFMEYGAQMFPVPVDENGIRLEGLPRKQARLLYVTPSHQFPTGAVLSLARRLELLAWAEKTGTLIVEDDYDSEFRYDARPIPSLQGMARNENVLYVGTFSKVLFPALRIGYLVVPSSLVDVFEKAKWLMDRHSPTLEQRTLVDFINEGHFDRHLRRMRKLYDRRRQKLVSALRMHFGKRVTILGENSGMHLMIRLKTPWGSEEAIKRADAAGIGLVDAAPYYLRHAPANEFVLGYSTMSERKIQEGIRRLASVLQA